MKHHPDSGNSDTSTSSAGKKLRVLIAMGNDVADKSLDVLQGRVVAPTESSTADESSSGATSTADESTTGG